MRRFAGIAALILAALSIVAMPVSGAQAQPKKHPQTVRKPRPVIPSTSTIPAREALSWVTLEGARMLRQLDRIGTLAPGKQADLVVIRASDLNMQPVHDPVSSVVFQASLANIDSVMVAGTWKKRAGRLLAGDLGSDLERLRASGRRITQALGLA